MAIGLEEGKIVGRKKRKRTKITLHIDERVEVRSEEDGFEGSWHQGTIINFSRQGWHVKYDVRYDHMLADDESNLLVDCLRDTLLVDDNDSSKGFGSGYRGRIRPLPPKLQFGKWSLPYGMCVDVYFQEGWWEGVIFDYEDGSDERRIFFPDVGDEMMTSIFNMRVTQDWNDVLGTWNCRGTWVFLELIEEFEQEQHLPVSVKQLWYDLREKEGFKKAGEWTCFSKASWGELVLDAIRDNLQITVNNIYREICLPEGNAIVSGFSGPGKYSSMQPEANRGPTYAIVPLNQPYLMGQSPKETSSEELLLPNLSIHTYNVNPVVTDTCKPENKVSSEHCALLAFSSNTNDSSAVNCITNEEGLSGSKSIAISRKHSSPAHSKTGWLPAVPDMVSGPEFCPEAVTRYVSMGKKKAGSVLLAELRKHLLFLKWKIEFINDKMKGRNIPRYRYTSPDGKCYMSLRLVCESLSQSESESISPTISGKQKSPRASDVSSLPTAKEPAENKIFPHSLQDVVSSKYHELVIEPEYCPRAVVNWYKHKCGTKNKKEKDIMITKARRHLSAVGWTFSYTNQRGRSDVCYISPWGKSYSSLRQACEACLLHASVSAGRLTGRSDLCKFTKALRTKESGKSKPDWSHFTSRGELGGLKIAGAGRGRRLLRRSKDSLLLEPQLSKEGNYVRARDVSIQKSRKRRRDGPLRLQECEKRMQPNRSLCSSRRVQQVLAPRSSHHNPHTVLSWLIDNNVLLPRENVYYSSRNDGFAMAEGRVTRDGIKCICCNTLYTVSGFAVHAGGEHQRPTSRIFLEDGRSLLDCQVKLIHGKITNFRAEQPDAFIGNWPKDENDYICSVCHYGGNLILCDQCPSSFHSTCLGMRKVPDGEWFCPSCCCGICGKKKLKEDDEKANYHLENNTLLCTQCRCKYHTGCLKDSGISLSSYPQEACFCSKKCERIFSGLNNLLGKQMPLGYDDLTWTLLRPIRISNASDIETLAETYFKLSIALEIMHECFKPVEEPQTGRDLVEDVIFCKKSGLKRLDFEGFYTVVLEKGDEIITVATLRVHGEDVAELPLVGTRFQYRRRGMCRVLLSELEKKLMEFGVQRLILPAVPNVLNTWIGSFGFSKMADLEKLDLVKYTFLDFQGTVKCCKQLMNIVSPKSIQLTEMPSRLCDTTHRYIGSIDLDGSSVTVCEECKPVCVTSDLEQGLQIVEQGCLEDAAGNNSGGSNSQSSPSLVKQQTNADSEPYASVINVESCTEDLSIKEGSKNNYNGSITLNKESQVSGFASLKCYKRRKLLV